MVSRPLRTAVVGGGVLGVSTATQLVRAGADVVLMTEGELTSNASGRSLSWLNSAGVRADAYHRLRMAGIDRYRTLAAHHPVNDWLRFGGGLAWTTAAEAERMRDWHRSERARGYDSHLLGPDQVARRRTSHHARPHSLAEGQPPPAQGTISEAERDLPV